MPAARSNDSGPTGSVHNFQSRYGCAMPLHQNFLLSLQDLLSVIEGMHDNVAIVDKDGVIRWISQCFERTYNVRREEILGRTTYDLEREKIFTPSVAAIVLRSKRMATVTETSRDGQYHIVTGIPIYDEDGGIRCIVSYSVDTRYSLKLYDEYENIAKLMQGRVESVEALHGVVAVSPAMRSVLTTVTKVAGVDVSLLITGESGVGKNVVARLVHQRSGRRDGPFVEINCAGIPEALLESELFGYEAGAFTGAHAQGRPGRIAQAQGGTLFLDEVGELPLALQAKLLQVIQEKQIIRLGGTRPVHIDFRLITATNQNLEALVRKKYFRSDLFFRLNVMPITVAPLRERPEDILPLCRSALEKLAQRYKLRKKLSPAVERRLMAYQWPGNVRELFNVIERMLVVAESAVIEEGDLPEHILASQNFYDGETGLNAALEHLERHMVLEAYRKYRTTTATARALGISQSSAVRKIQKYRGVSEKGEDESV